MGREELYKNIIRKYMRVISRYTTNIHKLGFTPEELEIVMEIRSGNWCGGPNKIELIEASTIIVDDGGIK